MELKFKRLHPGAQRPRAGSAGAAGLDLVATEHDCHVVQGSGADLTFIHTYHLGLAVQIPDGYVGLLVARSSVSKTGASLANGVGVIDSDYRGELLVKLYSHGEDRPYALGDRVAQLLVVPCVHGDPVEVDTLDTTARGTGGFGSSGA